MWGHQQSRMAERRAGRAASAPHTPPPQSTQIADEIGRAPTSATDNTDVFALEAGIAAFRAAHSSGSFSTSRTVNPLLDLWELAHQVDPTVAVPLESLLSVLVRRSLTTSVELSDTLDRVGLLLEPLRR